MNFIYVAVSFALLGASVQGSPWIAEPRTDQGWLDLHHRYQNTTASIGRNISIIFYGASIMEFWGNAGKDIFQQRYAPIGTVDYGIGGDRIEHLLYRISDGEVTAESGLSPKLIVIQVGANNGADSTDDCVRGYRALLDLLLQKLPKTKIILLGIFPRSDTLEWFLRVKDINIKISKFEDRKSVFFLDMFNELTSGWLKVNPDLFVDDKLHLQTAGYQVWADTMAPLFNELIK